MKNELVKRLNVNFPDDVYKALKIKMAKEETTLTKYILKLVKKDLK